MNMNMNMNTLTFPPPAAPEMPRDKASGHAPYSSEVQTNALLRFGAQYGCNAFRPLT
jgi:hypothetical protein